MLFKLPNGNELELEQVRSVSQIRDLDSSSQVMPVSRIGFTVSLKNREIVEVFEQYHYADWGPVKMRMKQLRETLISKIKEINPDFEAKPKA